MGVDEIYRGKKGKFLTVVCNLETAEPLWFGRERKKERSSRQGCESGGVEVPVSSIA
jgi:hypothetical protein